MVSRTYCAKCDDFTYHSVRKGCMRCRERGSPTRVYILIAAVILAFIFEVGYLWLKNRS